MNPKSIMTVAVTLMVGVILVAGILTPVIADSSSTTISIDNEGAQWVRMAYVSDDTDYSVSVDVDGDVTITNGGTVQTGSVTDMIVYADSLCSVFISDGDIIHVGSNGNGTQMIRLGDSFTIERASGVLTIGDGTSVYQPSGSVEWAYVPIGTGTYGSFGAGGLQRDQTPLVAVGSFAGVNCYNSLITSDYGFVMDADVTSEYINSVKWVLGTADSDSDSESDDAVVHNRTASPDPVYVPDESTEDTPDPTVDDPATDVSTDPGDTGPTRALSGGEPVRAVPTPTYTDGDWGYELDANNNATIVSYSGAGGGVITVPSTVGGYTVTYVGKGGNNQTVFNTSISATGLVFSSGITRINAYAFLGCSGITGHLIIPDTVTSIRDQAFRNCSGFTALTIPITFNANYNSSFSHVSNLTEVTFTKGVTGEGYNYGSYLNTNGTPWGQSKAKLTSVSFEEGILRIGSNLLYGFSDITGSLVLPSTLTSIGWAAFQDCSGYTGALIIPSAVTTIADYTFNGCSGFDSLTFLTTSSVNIGSHAFEGCSGITGNVILPAYTSNSVASATFKGCSGITSITLPNAVSALLSDAFYGCSSLVSINLDRISSIQNSVFAYCTSFTTFTIPARLSSLGSNVFMGTNITEFIVASQNTKFYAEDGVLFSNNSDGVHLEQYPTGNDRTAYTIPNTVKIISPSAFMNCTRLTGSLVIPDGVKEIGASAFSGCSGFTGTLIIPESVSAISSSAFRDCSGFDALVISNGNSTLGNSAFYNCTGMTSITIPDTIPITSSTCFYGVANLTSVTITAGGGTVVDYTTSTAINTPWFISRANLTTVTFAEGVSSIGANMLYGCSNISTITIPINATMDPTSFDGVTNITTVNLTGTIGEDYTDTTYQYTPWYYSRANVSAVSFADTITEIGDYTFMNCLINNMTLVLPENLERVGDYAFNGCSGFTGSLIIPNSTTEIGESAFNLCSGLTGSLVIPVEVTVINECAFSNCGFDGTLTLSDGVIEIGGSAFAFCSGFTGSLIIPNSVIEIGDNAFQGCSGFTTLSLSGSLIAIGDSAFSECSGLTGTLELPDGIEVLDDCAFYGCNGFTGTLVLPLSTTYIGREAFYGCEGMKNLIVESDAVPEEDAFAESGIRQVLNLGSADYTATSYGLDAEEVGSEISADCYVCIVSYEETVYKEGAIYSLLPVIPLVAVAGLVIGVGVSIMRRGGE